MSPRSRAAALAVVLAICGAVGWAGRATPVFPETPLRAHHALGPVAITADTRAPGADWSALLSPELAAQARARYGRQADAVIQARHTDLPNGSGAAASGLAIAWD